MPQQRLLTGDAVSIETCRTRDGKAKEQRPLRVHRGPAGRASKQSSRWLAHRLMPRLFQDSPPSRAGGTSYSLAAEAVRAITGVGRDQRALPSAGVDTMQRCLTRSQRSKNNNNQLSTHSFT
jgi:hypothetical protein